MTANPLDTKPETAILEAELRNSFGIGGQPAPVSSAVFLRPSLRGQHAGTGRKPKGMLACSYIQVSNPRSLDTIESVRAPATSDIGARS